MVYLGSARFVALLASAMLVGEGAAMDVPVRIVNDGDTALPEEIVSFGMPLRFGEIYDPARLRIRDAAGKPLPAQTRILGAWPDGSVQWVLVTTRTDLPASAAAEVRISDAEPSEPATPPADWRVDEGPDRVAPRVEVGPVAIEFDPDDPENTLFRVLTAGGDAVPAALVRVDGEDALGDWSFRLEETGDLRAVVRFEGREQTPADVAGIRVRGRVIMTAGNPLVRVRYWVVNESADPVEVRGVVFRLGGVAVEDLETVPVADAVERVTSIGRKADGLHMAAAVSWAGERGPHRFRFAPGGFEAGFATDADEPMTLAPGMAVDDEIWFVVAGNPAPAMARVNALARRDVVAAVDPAWIAATGALGALAPADPGTRQYDDALDRWLALRSAACRDEGAIGLGNFGDWRFPDGRWGNCEYDLAHGLFLQFARTGDPEWFRRAEEAAAHFMAVDVRHAWPADPALVGAPHIHADTHTGGGAHLGHTWLQGVLTYGLLTGETEALEIASDIGRYLERSMVARTEYRDREPRAAGWALLGLTSLYRATSDRAWLEAADIVFDRAFAARDPDGLLRYRVDGDCPHRRVAKPFMTGIILEGAIEYARVSGDPRIREFVVDAVDATIDTAWIPEDHGFRYVDCPECSPHGRAWDTRMLPGLAFAWALTGDERYREIAAANYAAAMERARSLDAVGGKEFGIVARSVPRYLAMIAGDRDHALAGIALASEDAAASEDAGFEVRGWQAHWPDMDRLRRAIPIAAEHGINHFQVSHHIVHDAEDLLNDPERCAQVRKLGRLCHDHGIRLFSWTHELNAVPDRYRRDGKVDLDDDALWEWVREKYRRFFELAPEVDGLILTFHETDVPVYYDDRVASSLPHPQRVTKLIDTVHEVCADLDKILYVRTFIYRPEELEWVIEGIQACPPGVRVMSKCEPHDWHPWYPHNPALGRFPGRLQMVEIDLGCEYYGQSRIPYALHRYQRYRLDYALQRGARGAVTRVGRNANPVLGTVNALNLDVFARLTAEPYASADRAWDEAICARYGDAAAEILAPALTSTWETVNETWLTRGFYFLNNHSKVPSLGYARGHVPSHSVGKWDQRFRDTERRLARPDPALRAEVVAEKDRAVARAAWARAEAERALPLLSPEQAEEVGGAFARLDRSARLWRAMAEAWVDLELWRVAPDDDRKAAARASLDRFRTVAEVVGAEADDDDEQWASRRQALDLAGEIARELGENGP